MKKIVSLVGALGVAFAGTNLTLAADKTSGRVQALANAEGHLGAVLRHFRDTAAWKAQYQAAVDAQSVAMAAVNADLFPEPRALSWVVYKSLDTRPFFVNGPFTLSWSTRAVPGNNCGGGVYVLVLLLPAGSKVAAGKYSGGPFEQDNCGPFSAQVSGVTGEQFLDITVAGAAVTVEASGAISP